MMRSRALISLATCCWAGLSGPTDAQVVEAVATFHNIGVEVTFPEAPGPGLEIALACRPGDSALPYRMGHPLTRISDTAFAGSAFGLEAATSSKNGSSGLSVPGVEKNGHPCSFVEVTTP